MQMTFFDFEATGKFASEALPVSCSYLVIDERLYEAVKAGTLYFHKPGVNYDAPQYKEARAIHGLTEDFLKPYEKDYDENVNTLYAILNKANLCGYNVKSYDNVLAANFFARELFGYYKAGSVTDVMSIYQPVYHKRHKLRVLCEVAGISDAAIKIFYKKWYGVAPEHEWHDASWDVTATALLYINALKKQYI